MYFKCIICIWILLEKFYHHHVHTFRGGLCWLSAEISALSLVSLVNSGYTNFTCLSTNSRTGREASMTYIVHYLRTYYFSYIQDIENRAISFNTVNLFFKIV